MKTLNEHFFVAKSKETIISFGSFFRMLITKVDKFGLSYSVTSFTKGAFTAFFMIGFLSLSAQVNVQPLASLTGISGAVTPVITYRKTTETFYAIPPGKSILHYNDLDKAWMESSFQDEQILIASTADDDILFFSTVIDPARQFSAQVMPYRHIVIGQGQASFIDLQGKLMHTTPTSFSPQKETLPERNGRALTWLERTGFLDAKLMSTVGGVSKYEGPDYLLTIDETAGLVRSTFLDDQGQVEWTTSSLYDLTDPDRILPEFEMTVFNETLPSGECVFKVEMTSISAYRDFPAEKAKDITSRSSVPDVQFDEVKVWPNPTQHILYIQSNEWQTDNVQVWLMSLDGKLLLNENMAAIPTIRINVQALPAGTYILRATSGNQIITKKVIIQ